MKPFHIDRELKQMYLKKIRSYAMSYDKYDKTVALSQFKQKTEFKLSEQKGIEKFFLFQVSINS